MRSLTTSSSHLLHLMPSGRAAVTMGDGDDPADFTLGSAVHSLLLMMRERMMRDARAGRSLDLRGDPAGNSGLEALGSLRLDPSRRPGMEDGCLELLAAPECLGMPGAAAAAAAAAGAVHEGLMCLLEGQSCCSSSMRSSGSIVSCISQRGRCVMLLLLLLVLVVVEGIGGAAKWRRCSSSGVCGPCELQVEPLEADAGGSCGGHGAQGRRLPGEREEPDWGA